MEILWDMTKSATLDDNPEDHLTPTTSDIITNTILPPYIKYNLEQHQIIKIFQIQHHQLDFLINIIVFFHLEDRILFII